MNIINKFLVIVVLAVLARPGIASTSESPDLKEFSPTVIPQAIEQAKKNDNWKFALATGKHAQIVLMNVSPETNPKNEIGMETHPFDQVIVIAGGNGKAILNNKISSVKSGDIIFIPLGTPHNVINSDIETPLKLISIYSDTDIPSSAVYKKKIDEPQT